MAGPTKRTRQEDDPPTPSSSSSSASTSTPTPMTRNNSTSSNTTTTRRQATSTNTPSSSTTTRPILTRSAANQPHPPPPNGGLSRSTSLFSISTRRTNFSLSSSSSSSNLASTSLVGLGGLPGPSPALTSSSSGSSSGRGGMLLRTQSTPTIASPTQLKASTSAAAAGGGSGSTPKGGNGDMGLGGTGGRRFGKGKENIPPKKEEDKEEGSSRKRLRVGSRGSYSGSATGRGRSGSVASVRSETTGSGRHSSLAPSSSASSIGSWGGVRLPSPSPSQASFSAQSVETATSADPLDLLKDDDVDPFDLDRTPTKARPVTRRMATGIFPPTPPPSSPSLRSEVEIDSAAARVSLMRMQTERSDSLEDTDVEMDGPQDKYKMNSYKQLKSSLRLSSTTSGATIDQTIVGRDEEKATLRAYLTGHDENDVGMYVSGPPGTGKTALVTALGRQMSTEGWKIVELGCMGLKLTDVWRRIGEELQCGKSEKDVKEFIGQDSTKVFIILDEVDSLMPPPPSIAPPATSHLLTKLFSLPHGSSNTKVVAISNTLDLTLRARLVLPDSLQPQVLPFKAYGAFEMTSIVNARLASANVEGVKVDPTAVVLLGRKVEAQNGDLRMCLGVLGSAVSLAEAEWIKKLSIAAASGEDKVVPMTKVAVGHVMKALTSYTQQLRAAAGSSTGGNVSATSKKIRSVQLQGKMVLMSMLVFLSRVRAGLNGCPAIGSGAITPPSTPSKIPQTADITISTLYATYSHILSNVNSPFPPAAESDYRDLLSNLETLGLVSVATNGSMSRSHSASSRSKSANAGKVELCVREEEVREGLGLLEGQSKGVAEEEVKRVWEREESKVRRVKEKLAQATANAVGDEDMF
ncbi:hypothetical protein CI109_106058 [Kwoniella shandongensis]|uniref:Uncharacterized protein n=1 Tax=Kwoniella shandongensis TaxID=1734106 RepID=A0A5M6BXP0_9TREE|nr:uncharacterized protein CI109_003887 [Kwoniella shandongensis]KAA5527628.1 hypothetical protein CI109_003887 [Kwoniella shandongensis]